MDRWIYSYRCWQGRFSFILKSVNNRVGLTPAAAPSGGDRRCTLRCSEGQQRTLVGETVAAPWGAQRGSSSSICSISGSTDALTSLSSLLSPRSPLSSVCRLTWSTSRRRWRPASRGVWCSGEALSFRPEGLVLRWGSILQRRQNFFHSSWTHFTSGQR